MKLGRLFVIALLGRELAQAPDPTVVVDPLASSKFNEPMPIEASWGPSQEYLNANAAWGNVMDLMGLQQALKNKYKATSQLILDKNPNIGIRTRSGVSLYGNDAANYLRGLHREPFSGILISDDPLGSMTPQDTRTNMTPEQISGLRKDLENFLKGKCKDLVEAMLKNVKGGVYTTNLLDLYKVLEDRHELYSHPGIKAGGYGGGSVDDKTARLAINFQYGWSSPVWTAIEELTHANGPAGSKYISHEVMAQAAINGARSLGINLDPLKNTGSKNSELGDPTTLPGDFRNSVLFRDVLWLGCH